MQKRQIIKSVLVTIGILLLIFGGVSYWFFSTNEIDKEKRVTVYVASRDIKVGDLITDTDFKSKVIKESALTSYMVKDKKEIVNKITLRDFFTDDYANCKYFVDKKIQDDEKTIIIPVDVDLNLANLVKTGDLIDIKVSMKDKLPLVVLSKIKMGEMVSENGGVASTTDANTKSYIKLTLNKADRDKIYAARSLGKLIAELYVDSSQNDAETEFVIPQSFYENPYNEDIEMTDNKENTDSATNTENADKTEQNAITQNTPTQNQNAPTSVNTIKSTPITVVTTPKSPKVPRVLPTPIRTGKGR